MKRTLLVLLSGLALLMGMPTAQARPSEPPNVLLLFADDQREDTIAAWGNRHIDTPHLDRLVRRGCSFRNNYCFGSNSGAVCIPSRAMLLSGRSWFEVPANLGKVTLLPEVLRSAGYITFMTGKWHNGEPSLVRAFPQARSVFLGGMDDHTRVPIADVVGGKIVNRRIAEKFSSEQFADAAIEFLQSHRGKEPFFCYVPFTAPHDPRNPPEAYRQRYYRARPPLPANFRALPAFDNGLTKNIRDENLAAYPRTREVISDQLCEYYGLISHLDEQVGRILAALEKSGRANNTVVIYTADHGLALGSHGLLGKQSLYEHSMKAPLIIAGPGVPAGRSIEAFTYLFDLFPTLCELAGVQPASSLAGHSLVPLWTGQKKALRDSVFLPYSNLMRSVRDDRWKLIVYPPINYRELFNLQADPHEWTNLGGDPSHSATLERLLGLMKTLQARFQDRQPLQVEKPRSRAVRFDDFQRKPDPWQPRWIVEKYFGKSQPGTQP